MRSNSRFRMKKQRSKRISAPTDRKLRSSKNECVCQMVVKPLKDLRLFQLREENEFTDAVVRSQDGGCEKKVHGIILASLSPDFQQKLLLGRETSLNLPCSAEVVNCLINLAYTGGCEVKNEFVEEVLDTAQVYGIKALKKIGSQFLIDHLCDDSDGEVCSNVEIYNCRENSWSQGENFNISRSALSVAWVNVGHLEL